MTSSENSLVTRVGSTCHKYLSEEDMCIKVKIAHGVWFTRGQANKLLYYPTHGTWIISYFSPTAHVEVGPVFQVNLKTVWSSCIASRESCCHLCLVLHSHNVHRCSSRKISSVNGRMFIISTLTLNFPWTGSYGWWMKKAEGNLQSFPTLPNNAKNGSITISIFTHVITDEEIITVLLFDTSSLM